MAGIEPTPSSNWTPFALPTKPRGWSKLQQDSLPVLDLGLAAGCNLRSGRSSGLEVRGTSTPPPNFTQQPHTLDTVLSVAIREFGIHAALQLEVSLGPVNPGQVHMIHP